MFVSTRRDANVKIIDYGLSKILEFEGQQHIDEGVGTIYSMAPEVLNRDYDSQADLWSIGVISYMLLSSSMPFDGINRAEVIKKIRIGKYSFASPRWKKVSVESRRFISALLVKDPTLRLTAEQALHNPWLDADFKKQDENFDQKSMQLLSASLERYSKYSKLKKLALLVVAHKSTCSEIGELREAFEKFDFQHNGTVCFEEFKEMMITSGNNIPEEHLQQLFNSIDLDGHGLVSYTEFIAATIEARGEIDDERLVEAFSFFDSDNSGFITKDSIKNLIQYGFLGRSFSDAYVDEVVGECDLNADGIISFEEFMSLWGRKKF
jgi:calcium-dependent protein kinase